MPWPGPTISYIISKLPTSVPWNSLACGFESLLDRTHIFGMVAGCEWIRVRLRGSGRRRCTRGTRPVGDALYGKCSRHSSSNCKRCVMYNFDNVSSGSFTNSLHLNSRLHTCCVAKPCHHWRASTWSSVQMCNKTALTNQHFSVGTSRRRAEDITSVLKYLHCMYVISSNRSTNNNHPALERCVWPHRIFHHGCIKQFNVEKNVVFSYSVCKDPFTADDNELTATSIFLLSWRFSKISIPHNLKTTTHFTRASLHLYVSLKVL